MKIHVYSSLARLVVKEDVYILFYVFMFLRLCAVECDVV